MPNPLAHPIEQAGGLQGGVPGSMANLYLLKTTVNESISQGASHFIQKMYRLCLDVFAGFCGLHYVGTIHYDA